MGRADTCGARCVYIFVRVAESALFPSNWGFKVWTERKERKHLYKKEKIQTKLWKDNIEDVTRWKERGKWEGGNKVSEI